MTSIKGYRTVAFGLLLALAPAALTYVGGIDWTSYGLSPAVGVLVGAIVMALRTMTTTPVGKSVP